MLLTTVYIRFYKSFNYDYLKKYETEINQVESVSKPWELIDDMWYPYVEIPIDDRVTTVVGANESGKSHLLSAIEKAILGKDFGSKEPEGREIRRDEFCRYSNFFTVKAGKLKFPSFGLKWENLNDKEQANIRSLCNKIRDDNDFKEFYLFRINKDDLVIYLKEHNEYVKYDIKGNLIDKFIETLPHIFRIDSEIALPKTIPIKKLIKRADAKASFEDFDRKTRGKAFKLIEEFSSKYKSLDFDKIDPYQKKPEVEAAWQTIKSLVEVLNVETETKDNNKNEKAHELAYKLICEVAGIDSHILSDLIDALEEGKDGYVNGVIEMINERLAESLNFPKWWAQDSNFCLKVSPRDSDLVFTIRDRTGTEYSFDERSSGLRYFLSYYIQYRIHKPHLTRSEILLMDEPDTYLSSRAQQDLLKIFEEFANPRLGSHITQPIQVIYVTHSPFLINKNYPERIRVLEKGDNDEGTRVVKDAGRNHYEPLRSAFGAFVGETTFIGNCNLIVEGTADQILIAGAASYLRSLDVPNSETLDLNHVTIVPVDSASQILYTVYLARGKDVEQPAVIVLIDSNQSGDDARKKLLKLGSHRQFLLDAKFIIQIGDLSKKIKVNEYIKISSIEDIIPIGICIEAAKVYAEKICGVTQKILSQIEADILLNKLKDVGTIFEAIESCFNDISANSLYIDRVGFARSVVDTVNRLGLEKKRKNLSEIKLSAQNNLSISALEDFEKNFRILFEYLDGIRMNAVDELTNERNHHRIDRLVRGFNRDNPISPKREVALELLKKIESSLEDDIGAKKARSIIKSLRENYELEIEKNKIIENYEEFQRGLKELTYSARIESQSKSV
ncbi:AAA family ATPase [Nostoc sphaeroides]|uniref:OLD family endonuclease n=1 Tax=Nostoc sphaeroides CCNUC1 TaxID=2653204 RepID=A0A5P8W5I0_9NOSO|nr:AAA family ATPase [Nostoc sphaeroides]QFS47997.1 OLD family endonuclease [Nostoc sphaeroides CCNUC1]